MKSLLTVAAAGLALAACAPTEDPTPTPVPDQNLAQCQADRYQSYVGRQRSELPAKPDGANWRVACSTCAVTMDFNAQRMNVVYDQNTNVITRIYCG